VHTGQTSELVKEYGAFTGDKDTPYMHNIWKLTNGPKLYNWEDQIAGIGQGNGTGPHIWAMVSMVLFNDMCEDGMFAKIVCAISHQKWS